VDIYFCRALDSDDIELVRLLLEEKKLNLDGAHALHYAAAHCDPRTMAMLLDLKAAGKFALRAHKRD
jgi:regulatory protein NPR1